ncbi:MAG: leucine-rich repeat domain-containing protein, partial [Muribaculaceae bacterium]|nr:leucine-rich repeat domain-containing protein [Muribaculaceae bacterium]
SFTVRAGALKNISNTDFSGKLSVALFGTDGKMKCLLNDGRNFNLIALQIYNFLDFLCSVPAGTAVEDGDIIRIVAQKSFETEWLPVAGDGLAPGEALAKNNAIPYFRITLPASSDDAEVSASDDKVIKGRDYTFSVVPKSADRVVTVKANGFILTADANNGYRLSNVIEDQKIELLVQNASDVLTKKTVWVTAGNLQNLLTEQEAASVVDLTLFGTINANDFNFMRDRMKLNRLDISQVSIVAQGSNPANAIPTKAFMNYRSLKQIILPNNLTTFKNGCLAQTGLTSIEVPANVGTWEYNVFVGCNALQEVIVRRSNPAWINWCVFNGTPKAKLVVPVGAAATYKSKEYWQEFKEVIEENPVAASHYTLTVAEQKGIKFNALTEGTEFEPKAKYKFSAETDDSFGDATMQVYANTTRLYPDKDGNFEATVNANTLIHFEFSYPEATTADTAWKLTAAEGGVGLVTDVVNVPVGKAFTVRANAIKVPNGAEASKFYCMALTDKNGAIKEIISTIFTNYSTNSGNLTFDFVCQVKEASVKEGNELRLITSYNKKNWTVVNADAAGVTDRIKAINNQVAYHSVTMPQSVNGAKIEGAVTEVVRGMPLNLKVTPISPLQRVTLAVNGVNKVVSAAVANLSITSVTEDIEITIIVKDAGATDYVVVNVKEGELATKIAECPARLKVMGTMLVDEFAAFRNKSANILDLDLADLTIKGAAMTGNSIPTNAFAPTQPGASSALRSIILPKNLERISDNAFARCGSLKEVVIPASVNYLGAGAFSACNQLSKITMEGKTPPACGNMTPFPSNSSGISLVVPKGAESAYSTGYWTQVAPKVEKSYYWVKYDPTIMTPWSTTYDLNKLEVGNTNVQPTMALPNCPSLSKAGNIRRPGAIFKLYDNGHFILDEDYYGKSSVISTKNRFAPDQYGYGGQYTLQFDPSYESSWRSPQNHELEIVFFHSITFENLEGAEGITPQLVEINPDDVYTAELYLFTRGATGSKTVYREGKDYKVRLSGQSSNVNLSVAVENKILVKPGETPTFETKTFEIYPDEKGLYTIPALPGDTWVRVSGSLHVEEGKPVPSEDLSAVSKDEVAEFTELTVTGTLDEAAFEAIKEKFEVLETLDLSGMENEVIPAGAFEGMPIKDVVVPETVVEIGAGAFAGCENIESLTLPGVTSIGEGAFEGCDNLTSILLPALGSATVSGKPGMKRAGEVDGVSADSFKGLNPNCLIYVGAEEIPGTEAYNVILNKKGLRVAASDIILDGNHAFNAPASFNLGDHNISFTTEIIASDSCDVDGGWKTLMLPFQPTEMKVGAEFANRAG